MKTNWQLIEEEWQKKYAKLESEMEHHRISFILTKKCGCKTNECKHYEHENIEIFGKCIDVLLAKRILINASAAENAMKQNSGF